MAKYKNSNTIIDGIKFDSKDESLYYLYLKDLLANKEIANIELQPKYTLIPKFKYFDKNVRAMTYAPDFKVTRNDGSEYLIDVKSMGTATQQGELRRKLFEYYYNDVELIWICRNMKHSDGSGWVIYEDLKKIYREIKKAKKEAKNGTMD